ncbi:MAG: hypothetical protein IJI44_05360 [Erysipelotrichaceae bacterium]|nr:hypothetical protein [Erysipelotrichaceae bacterium]
MKSILQKIISVLFCILLCLSCSVFVYGEENDETEIIHSRFYVITCRDNRSIEVPFNRNWFKQDATSYSHDLAKLSLGLATAAFRPKAAEISETNRADQNLNLFLEEAHFTDLRSDDYDKDPDRYTVSTAMGHQRIEDEDGGFELIAVGVCGQGYMDEWESNFSIGNGEIHDGFLRSSRLVFDRIFGYIAGEHLEGPFKIWISGFSRAAAISNVTAAMLTDSSLFSQENVFAYTFATPRTAVDEEYGRYKNIFNIVGKADPVPNVPFADWGFERYGTTFYTPVLETDSDFEAKRVKANQVYKELTGIDYWYNREANAMIRTILSYLLEICPTAEIYSQSLQNKLIHIWENRDPVTILSNLLDMANDPVLINKENQYEANALLNYMVLLMQDYIGNNSVFRGWNRNASTAANVVQAHTPELYISWIFSTDDPEQLYNEHLNYNMVYIYSPADVYLYNDKGEQIESIKPIYTKENDEYSVQIKENERVTPEGNKYLLYIDDSVVAMIPKDREYSIYTCPKVDDNINFFEFNYTIGRFANDKLYFFDYSLRDGDGLKVKYTADGNREIITDHPFEEEKYNLQEYTVDTSVTINLTRSNPTTIYWRDAVIYFLAAVMAVISIVLFQLVYLVGRIRFERMVRKGWIPQGRKYRALPFLCVFTIFLLFIIMEFYKALFPESKNLVLYFKLIIGLISVAISLIGYLHNKNRLVLMIMISLIILMFADTVMTVNMLMGAFLHISAYLTLSYGFIQEEKPDRKQIAICFVLSLIGVVLLSYIKGEYGILRIVAMLYLCAAILMVTTSFALPRRTFMGALLLFLSGILLMNNEINGTTFLSHIISLGTYYAAIATLASTATRVIMPRLVPAAIDAEDEEEIDTD